MKEQKMTDIEIVFEKIFKRMQKNDHNGEDFCAIRPIREGEAPDPEDVIVSDGFTDYGKKFLPVTKYGP
jgi:hypothetical protein